MKADSAPRSRLSVFRRLLSVASLIVLGSFILSLQHLGHSAIKPLDEVFHAIVARNFLKHPLVPTLNDPQYLSAAPHDWQNAGIWLHKPPMAMWQIAASFALFGTNAFALRLPSAILAALSAWLTYRIGRELLDRTSALLAAALQAFCPAIMMLVHGHVFSDHVDIALLFWSELAIYFLIRSARTRARRDLVLCGLAQGLAFLSKTYPALIVSVLALFLWGLGRLRGRGVLVLLGVSLATVLPWTLWTAIRWPAQFAYENLRILSHISQDVEGWAAPWDRLAFDYSIRIYHVFYPAALTALIIGVWRAIRHRDRSLWLLIAWALGVLVPHLLATSKTMTATLIGWPPMWLLLGKLISDAARGDGLSLGAWTASMLLEALGLRADDIPSSGWGYASVPGIAIIMRQHLWVIWHVAISLAAGVAAGMLLARRPLPRLRWTIVAIASCAMLFLAVRWWGGDHPRGYAYLAWRVTQLAREHPSFSATGRFARQLPPDAVFMVDEQTKLENKLVQFAVDRTCYPLPDRRWESMGRALIEAGALPYVITSASLPLPAVFVDPEENRAVYACTPKAKSAADRVRPLPGTPAPVLSRPAR